MSIFEATAERLHRERTTPVRRLGICVSEMEADSSALSCVSRKCVQEEILIKVTNQLFLGFSSLSEPPVLNIVRLGLVGKKKKKNLDVE